MDFSAATGVFSATPAHSEERQLWIRRNSYLILTACFARIWIFHRAFVQSITWDEADTFLHWVAPDPRDSYFREWRSGADVKTAFPVAVDLCRRAGVKEIASDPILTSSLNFYRFVQKVNDIDEVRSCETMPPDKSVYFLLESRYSEFVRKSDLQIAWRGSISDLLVLVRPGTPK